MLENILTVEAFVLMIIVVLFLVSCVICVVKISRGISRSRAKKKSNNSHRKLNHSTDTVELDELEKMYISAVNKK